MRVRWAVPVILGFSLGLASCASTYKALGVATDEDLAVVNQDIRASASALGPWGDVVGLGVTGALTLGWRVARKKGWIGR